METLTTYPATEQDYDFLYRLQYLGLYAYVFETWRMPEPEFQAIFRGEYANPARQVVCLEDTPIGMLLVEERCDSLFLDTVAILPEYQNRGYGTTLVRTVLDDAARLNKCVRLHVLKVNPAQKLYLRLGFTAYAEDHDRYYMETK